MSKLEIPEERKFVSRIKHKNLLCLKINVLGQRGWPDRLIIGPDAKILFIEFKRPDGRGRTSKLQDYIIGKLKDYGFKVIIVESASEALKAVSKVFYEN